jgi:ribonuclease BN (tRNA processing enzyme)
MPKPPRVLAEHVRDADVLVIEATFLNRDMAKARNYGHLAARAKLRSPQPAGESCSS